MVYHKNKELMALTCKLLNIDTLDFLIDFEIEARRTEGEIFTEDFDPQGFKTQTEAALNNPLFQSAHCLICFDEDKIIGRLDFSWVPSFAFGGDLQVYVDWIYVLKAHRHQGVAQKLFSHMETYIIAKGFISYFLLMAENPEAQKFYTSLAGTDISTSQVLKKYF